MNQERIMAALRNPFKWLLKVDPSPNITAGKVSRLLIKAFLFAITVQILIFSVLKPLGVPYINTSVGQFVVAVLVYIPFVRFINAEFKYQRRSGVGKTSSQNSKNKKTKAKKYAGTKGKGPRLY